MFSGATGAETTKPSNFWGNHLDYIWISDTAAMANANYSVKVCVIVLLGLVGLSFFFFFNTNIDTTCQNMLPSPQILLLNYVWQFAHTSQEQALIQMLKIKGTSGIRKPYWIVCILPHNKGVMILLWGSKEFSIFFVVIIIQSNTPRKCGAKIMIFFLLAESLSQFLGLLLHFSENSFIVMVNMFFLLGIILPKCRWWGGRQPLWTFLWKACLSHRIKRNKPKQQC